VGGQDYSEQPGVDAIVQPEGINEAEDSVWHSQNGCHGQQIPVVLGHKGPDHKLETNFRFVRDRRSLQHNQHAEMLVSRSKAKFGLDLGLRLEGLVSVSLLRPYI